MNESLIKSNSPAMSEDIRALAAAFLQAKQEFGSTGLGGTNAHQKYKYAKIEDIYRAVEGALAKNNIIIWHFARPESGIEYLHTRLIHTTTGQFIEDCRILESEKPGNQSKGAANTYMKKYAVLSLCAIATEDDDGEEEEKYIAQRKSTEPFNHQASGFINESQQSLLRARLNGDKELANKILAEYGFKSLSAIPWQQFNAVLDFIKANRVTHE